MFLAALIDAGAGEQRLRDLLDELGLGSVGIRVEPVERQGASGLHVEVMLPEDAPAWTWERLRALIEQAPLANRPRRRALAALDLLAEAEAAAHPDGPDDAVDTLVDLCGVAVLLEELGVDRVFSSPLPAVRADAGRDVVTATGAALARSLAESFGAPPPLARERIGYGAGTDDPPDRPNVLRVVIGTL